MRPTSTLYSRVNLTPLLDIIFILLFIFMGGVTARSSDSHAEAQRLAERERQLADQVERLTRERDSLSARVVHPHRTAAAAEVLSSKYRVFELRLEPDHWMTLEGPTGESVRLRITPEGVSTALARVPAEGSLLLVLLDPLAINQDALILRRALRDRGLAYHEYVLPEKR